MVHAFSIVTKLGDLAILFPLAALMLAWQTVRRPRGAAICWLAAFVICVSTIALFKMLFYACPPAGDFRNPSGHAALSTFVYGGFVTVIAADLGAWWRWSVIVMGGVLIAAIAMSRVFLNDHSLLEVLFGLIVGVSCLAMFCLKYLSSRIESVPLPAFGLGLIAILLLLYGHPVHAEGFLHRISGYLNVHDVVCR